MARILLRGMKSPFEAISAERTLDEDINGGNSGNLVFLESAYKLLSTRDAEITVDHFHPELIGADVINERFDAFVIPFANAFRPAFQPTLERYTEVIERLTIPVVVLSCGYQGKLPYTPPEPRPIDDLAKRFMRAVLDRSPSVGARGEYTQDYLRRLGFSDVEVIGCPSMFLDGPRLDVTRRRPTLERDARIAFNVTSQIPPMGEIIAAHLERYPNLEYIGQNRDALRLLLWGVGSDKIPDPSPFPAHRSHRLLREDRARLFVDPWPWFDHLRELDFVFGTRIHGNIAALLAGTPAYVLAHDSRTLELARTFEIPHRLMSDVRPDTDAAELYAEADYGPLVTGHAARFERFIGFVERHGLRHVFEPGEDPSAFDRKVAAIDFPPAVRVRRNVLLHRIRGRSGRLLRRVSQSIAPAARAQV
ncbi:MAG: polysaccharide pyruvyl transferase family protein [Chloroflexota bacterium]